MQFQFLSRIFQVFTAFLVFQIDVINTSQRPCIVELGLFFCPLLFFFFAEISLTYRNFLSHGVA